MGVFFKPWRRKIGCVTLVIASIFAISWARSFLVKDEFSIRIKPGVTMHFISNRSRFAWKTVTIDDPASIKFQIAFYFATPAKDALFYRHGDERWIWRSNHFGFEFGRFDFEGAPWVEELWILPCWSVVVPLTLLSAWLLIFKPRYPKPTVSQEPVPEALE